MKIRYHPGKHVRSRPFELALWAVALLFAVPAAAQQAYPSRPILIITTGIDALARAVGQKLSERWNIGVAVEARSGASGSIAADFVARALPDGHTLLMAPTGFLTNAVLNRKLTFDPVKSFTPVCFLTTGTLAFVVSNNTPAQSAKEFVALAKSNPEAFNYASVGTGSMQHLTFEWFKQEAGINVVHVPYKSAATAYIDLVGGRVNTMITTISTSTPLVKSGKIKLLAVLGNERSPMYPSVQTLNESGYPGLNVSPWNVLLGPAGMPPEVVRKLNSELNAILALADVKEVLAKLALDPVGGPPSRLSELLKSETERWQRVVTAAGIKPD